MKHPRDVILDQHQHAEPRLNQVRSSVLSRLQTLHHPPNTHLEEKRDSVLAQITVALWRELILPCRRIWISLATIWIFIAVVNFQMQSPNQAKFSSISINTLSSVIRDQLIRQNKLRASLLNSDITQPEEDEIGHPSAKLRSAIRREWMVD